MSVTDLGQLRQIAAVWGLLQPGLIMGIEFKLSDRELPASPAFIRFLDNVLSGRELGSVVWPDQLSEELVQGNGEELRLAAEAADRVMHDAVGRECVARAYGLLAALLTGDTAPLATFQSRFHFISVIGIPRTGGSYLTGELYRSLGINPYQVPGPLAHDSFPEAGPFELAHGFNSWVITLKSTAEFLTMVELFFDNRPRHSGKVVVPKKLTQGIYAAGLFQSVFGPESHYILTIRHPVAACVSTYEKSGGLPEGGCLRVRSNIERWCLRDLKYAGWTESQLEVTGYFDAYLRYWELYHVAIATTGLSCCGNLKVIPYGAAHMRSLAQRYHDTHGSGQSAADFQIFDKARQRHPDWVEHAQPAIERVRSVWSTAGLMFPADEIAQCE